MCHPLAGGKGGTQYQRVVRDLRFETADYRTVELCYPLSAVRFPREGEMVRPDSSDLSSGLRPAPPGEGA